MIQRLLRCFIRDIDQTDHPKVRLACGQFAGIFGILTNLLLVAAKLFIGILSGSIAIIADALNNLADAGSSIITLVGFRLAGKPADKEHPYGHARIEYVTGLMVSMSVVFIGLQLTAESVQNILSPEKSEISFLTVTVLVLAIFVKGGQGLFYRGVGKLIHSEALAANASDSFNDVILTVTVLVGSLLSKWTGWMIDGWFGLAVAVFILISGIKLIRETSDPLLGVAPSKELIHTVRQKILSYEGILGVHDLIVHSYGANKTFISAHAEVDAGENVLISHEVLDRIENDFRQDLGIQLVLHLDPIVTDDERVTVLKRQTEELLKEISPELCCHDFRVVFGKERTNLIFDVVLPFSVKLKDSELRNQIEKRFQKQDPSLTPVITIDRDFT